LNCSISFLVITAFTTAVIFIIIVTFGASLPLNITYGQQQQQHQPNNTNNNSSTKVVILTFGDTLKGQLTTAKPILDKYGFKASFYYI
jgi:peptidoglycan/xylan/chitin deacetylase (PgdA/CDA1 family)